MYSENAHFSVIDVYYELLKNLRPEVKNELILRLKTSIKGKPEAEKQTAADLFGAWEGLQSAEELIDSIKSDRQFKRKREEL